MEEMKLRCKMIIGNREKMALWQDNWYALGLLLDKFGDRIIYDSGLLSDTKVKEVIHHNQWSWPTTNFLLLLEIKIITMDRPIRDKDYIVWLPHSNGCFSINSVS